MTDVTGRMPIHKDMSKEQWITLCSACRNPPFFTVNVRNLRAAEGLQTKGYLRHVGKGRHAAEAVFEATKAGRDYFASAYARGVEGLKR